MHALARPHNDLAADVGDTGDSADPIAPPDRLAALEASAREAWRGMLLHSRLGAEHLLDAAAALTEALALCPAEAVADWLKGAGIPRAGARNLLELHRVALDFQALDALGGVPLAVAWAAEARLPSESEVLAVTLGDWHPERFLPVAYVWRCPTIPGHVCAGLLDLRGPLDGGRVTHQPLASERKLWGTVWHLLGHRYADMVFRPLPDASLVERLEARRQAVVKAEGPRVH